MIIYPRITMINNDYYFILMLHLINLYIII